jgi:hypothetical protein
MQLSSNRDFNLDTSLNVDDDLLDNLGRGVETAVVLAPPSMYVQNYSLNQTLVNTHLKSVPSL